jgi:hypothetical protein
MAPVLQNMAALLLPILFGQLVVTASFNSHTLYPTDLITIDYEQPDTAFGSSQTVDIYFDRTRWLSRSNIFRFTDIPADATNCQLYFFAFPVISETTTASVDAQIGSFTTQIDGSALSPTNTTWDNCPGPFGSSPYMGTLLQGSATEFSAGIPLDPRTLTLHPTAHAFTTAFTCPGSSGTAAFLTSIDLLYTETGSGGIDENGVWGTMTWNQGFGESAVGVGYQGSGFYVTYQTPCFGAACLFAS